MCRRFLNLFLAKGAVHGLPYVGKGRLTYIERIIWLVLTFVALYFSIHLALESLDRFHSKSTVISIERDYHYWNTTLPSATICPMERLSLDKFNAYCEKSNITGQDKVELFEFLESLANSSYFNFNNIKDHASIEKFNIDPMDYMYLIFNLTENALTSNESRVHAIWDTWDIHSQQVLTEWGICYTTNNYLIEKLSTSNLLFGKPAPTNPYERKGNLFSILKMNVFDDEVSFNLMGFHCAFAVFIHGAFEVISVEKRGAINYLPVDYTIRMYDITASDDFRKSTTVEQRQCRFPRESNLLHFPIYTRNLCHQECRINLAFKLCLCIPHFYPNRNTKKPVCHYKQLKNCLFKYASVFENLHKISNLSLSIDTLKCNCLPNCRSSEVLEKVLRPMTHSEGLLGGNGVLAIMKIYPKLRYQRQIIFTLTDLLVSIGGTAGFFLGSSVLGAVEIVYYFTVRLICHFFGYRE